MYDEDDKVMAEEAIENAVQYLRLEENKSQSKIDRALKMIRRECAFLREEFPESYVLKEGFFLPGELD